MAGVLVVVVTVVTVVVMNDELYTQTHTHARARATHPPISIPISINAYCLLFVLLMSLPTDGGLVCACLLSYADFFVFSSKTP